MLRQALKSMFSGQLTNLEEVVDPRVASNGKPAGPAPAAEDAARDVNAAATLDFVANCGAAALVLVGFDLKLRASVTELASKGISDDIFLFSS